MNYSEMDTAYCSIGRTVDEIGESWILLIVREVTMGVRRFSDIQEHIGISRSVLAKRIDHLVAEGILESRVYRSEGHRRRNEYVLTEKGSALYTILIALRDYGDRYLAPPEGPSSFTLHKDCGAEVRAILVCDAGHVVNGSGEVEGVRGPGSKLLSAA
jgi:DNA-binding HxlR family transcriptional regulator